LPPSIVRCWLLTIRGHFWTFYPPPGPLQLSLEYFLQLWWLPAVFISFIGYQRLYIRKLPFWDETRELLKAASVSMVTILAVVTLGKMAEVSRLTVLFLWFYSLFCFLSSVISEKAHSMPAGCGANR
jgi:hypothetical protein